MTTANVHQAKTNLSKLLDAASEGENVIITRRGGKITQFQLLPVQKPSSPHHIFGAYKDKIIFAPDYDQADPEITKMFEDSANKPL